MPRVMLDDPDGTLSMLRDSVAQFAIQHSGPRIFRDKRERAGDLDRAVWSAMAQAGWTGLLLPDTLGGAGLGMREQAILSEALGRALIAEPIASASVLSSALVAAAPDSEERQRLADGIASGRLIVTPAWQDKAGARGGMMVSATREAGGFVLNGAKPFVEAAGSASDFLVIAMSVDGSVLISVPADAPGVFITDRPGIDGAAVATVSFVECFVQSDRVLMSGDACEAALEQALLHARLALAAELAGIASSALESHRRLYQGSRAVRQADRELPVHPAPAGRHVDGRGVRLRGRRQCGRAHARRRATSPPAGSRCWPRRRGRATRLSPSAGAPCIFMARWALPTNATSASTSSAPSVSTLRSASPSSLRLQFVDLERAA